MKVAAEELERRMNRFVDTLKRLGMKMTHQRIEIFREVARTSDHPDAKAVFKGVKQRVPTVALDTVYRTLVVLNDLGLIATLGLPREVTRFDANLKPHHHYVCIRCGRARDFKSPVFDGLRAPQSLKNFGSVVSTHVEIRGLCARCSKKTEPTSRQD